jgi:hypothetical protein
MKWDREGVEGGWATGIHEVAWSRTGGGVMQDFIEAVKGCREGVEEGWGTGIHEAVVWDLGDVLKCNGDQAR